jgi:hypothetical protein
MHPGKIGLGVVLLGLVALTPEALAQRGGRGGGGMARGGGGGMPRGGGMSPGGFGGGMPMGNPAAMNRGNMAAMGPHGAGGMTGPGGGQYQAGARSGSYETQRGGTINYGAAGAGGTGPGGVSAGRGVYGVSGTTAGGRSYGDVGRVGGVQGPGGYGAVGRSNVGGVAGPNGAMVGGSRGAVGYGPGGAVGAGERGVAGAGPRGTYYASSAGMAAMGNAARAAYGGNYFNRGWYGGNPWAWAPAAYAGAGLATWPAMASFAGYPAQPAYYDYGGNVVSQPNAMYVNGDPAGTPQQYADQAGQIASAGGAAQANPNDTWQQIGVFGVAPNEGNPPNEFFQLAINKQGVIRGNYYNSAGDKGAPLAGGVDPKTLRAAWTIGDTQTPVFEVGIANLTKDQTTMLVHEGNEGDSQVVLVRMPPPDQGQAGGR